MGSRWSKFADILSISIIQVPRYYLYYVKSYSWSDGFYIKKGLCSIHNDQLWCPWLMGRKSCDHLLYCVIIMTYYLINRQQIGMPMTYNCMKGVCLNKDSLISNWIIKLLLLTNLTQRIAGEGNTMRPINVILNCRPFYYKDFPLEKYDVSLTPVRWYMQHAIYENKCWIQWQNHIGRNHIFESESWLDFSDLYTDQ